MIHNMCIYINIQRERERDVYEQFVTCVTRLTNLSGSIIMPCTCDAISQLCASYVSMWE